ncbi:MAG: EAL domain-containing protein [Nodosilinea sp. LVE1205-7]|jgi:diguanylate cyclase (GGDEF)-like protein
MFDSANLSSPIDLEILNGLPDAIVVVNQQAQPLYLNRQAKNFLLNHLDRLWRSEAGSEWQVLDGQGRSLREDQLPLRRILRGDCLENEELILLDSRSSQDPLWIALSGGPCEHGGDVAGVLSVRNISIRKKQEASLHHQALHDQLTGLPNRIFFIDQVNQILAQKRPDHSMAVLFMDLDRFKEVNDNLGHRVGNELLTQLGERLQCQVTMAHTIARLGGDEFAILLENLSGAGMAMTIAEQLREAIIQPFLLHQYEVYIDASIGIALGPTQYQNAEDWLRDADAAMYQIKDLPDRHWHIFDSSLQIQRSQRMQSEMELRQALAKAELRLHYQPIVTISTQSIIGFEALVRWQHPTRGLLMPGEFITTAEATGLIIPLGWWVLEEACRQMQAWSLLYPAMANLTMSVNMSSKQFSQQNLVEKVRDILMRTEFSPHRLALEVTEGVLINHSESIMAILEQLRAMGIRLAVDDFGTGYSSLSYLHRFPFDCLKIDLSFIENADQDFEKLEILQSVVRLAWNLGLDVVAEGVETQRHYAQLKALRCESGQGYLFSEPLSPQGIEALLIKDFSTSDKAQSCLRINV